MSDTDSFIDEVTEEVRRDRLFATMRRYGWIAVLAVLLLVGGAAYNEWRKAQDRKAAEALGDNLLSALESDSASERLTALDQIPAETSGARITLAFTKATELLRDGKTDEAVAALNAIAADGELPAIYRQIAGFRALVLQSDLPGDERRLQFEALGQSGGVIRLLGEEQIALIDIEEGKKDAALERLARILADSEVTSGLRRRATQLIVSLGGELPELATDAPQTNEGSAE